MRTISRGGGKVILSALQVKETTFEIAYNKYSKMLYRLAFSIVLSCEDAEDAVQNVFYKYLCKEPEFGTEEYERAWFVRVTINQCKDSIRRRKVRTTLPLDEIINLGVYDKQSEVLSTLFSLPEKYKIVLILYYMEGFKVEEIAQMAELSKSAVKMRLSRGRELLKDKL